MSDNAIAELPVLAPMAANGLRVIEPTMAHVYRLAANLRQVDVEMAARLGQDPKRALRAAYRSSPFYRRAAVLGDEVLVLWGLHGDAIGDVGFPFMLSSRNASRFKLALLKVAREALEVMLERRAVLVDYVAPDNAGAIRFLRFLGFAEAGEGPRPVVAGVTWLRFEMRR